MFGKTVEKLTRKFKMETSCYRGQVYRLSNSNFSSTDEELWRGTEVVAEDKNKEAERNHFLNQGLCQGHHRISSFAMFPTLVFTLSSIGCSGAAQGSVLKFTAPGHTYPSSMKPLCSHPRGTQPHQPTVCRAPTAFCTTVLQGDDRLLSGQGCHLRKHLHRVFRDFDNSEPNLQQSL